MTTESPADVVHHSSDRTKSTADAIDAILCPNCGYDIRAATRDVCPECDGKIDREALKKPQIPWAHRKERGRIRSFIRTVWMVLFGTRRLCAEIARPIDFKDATRFWLVTASLLFAATLLHLSTWTRFVEDVLEGLGERYLAGPQWMTQLFMWTMTVCSPIALFTMTRVHTYWFHPRSIPVEHQNRAVALSHYACAMLVIVAVGLSAMALGALLVDESLYLLTILFGREQHALQTMIGRYTEMGGIGLTGIGIVGFVWKMDRIATRSIQAGAVRRASLWFGVPICWLALAGLFLIAVPLTVAYVTMIFATFGG